MNKIILLLIINLFFWEGACQEVIDKVVAIVGENPILYSEIQGQKLHLLQQGSNLEENIDCFLLEEFMTQQLLIHQAEIDSLEVTEEMVKVELEQRIQYFSSQVGGTEALEDFYGQSIEEIKELGLASSGDNIIVVSGMPFGLEGSTNSIRIEKI